MTSRMTCKELAEILLRTPDAHVGLDRYDGCSWSTEFATDAKFYDTGDVCPNRDGGEPYDDQNKTVVIPFVLVE